LAQERVDEHIDENQRKNRKKETIHSIALL
jgi:hypothetical protein